MILSTGLKNNSMLGIEFEITKRQKHLLDELQRCDDEMSGQELHRQLVNAKNPWV